MGPNDFVNPNQRGVELPPGCKNLIDVLKMEGTERQEEGVFAAIYEPVISHGALSEIEQRFGIFLESGDGERLLSVTIPKYGILVILLKRTDSLTLNFSVPAKQQSVKDVVRGIFENPKFGENIWGKEYVSVALNSAKDAVARLMVKLLAEGFGVLEGERLMFVSYKGAEGTGEG